MNQRMNDSYWLNQTYFYNISDTESDILDASIITLRVVYGVGLAISFSLLTLLGHIELKHRIYAYIKIKLFIKSIMFTLLLINLLYCTICVSAFYDHYNGLRIRFYISLVFEVLIIFLP